MKIISTLLFTLFLALSTSALTPESRWAKLNESRIHYYDIGNAKSKNVLIFIHGWTCNADFWKDSYSAFSGYRVIALDLIGHGKSDKPKANYSMEYFARSVEAVLKKAKVQKAVLVGHSMGTPVARQFYRLYPDKTLGIVVVDGSLRSGTKAETEAFIAPLISNYKENAPNFLEGMLQPIKDANLKTLIRETMSAAPEYVAVSAMSGMADERIWTNDQIMVPVLAIMAEAPWWKPDTKDFYQTIAPNLEYHMWTGVSHFLMMEKPKEFNEQVATFLLKNKLL
ncbi:MAG: alpha/beta fold hydrolase [Blastocatellia bacterium]